MSLETITVQGGLLHIGCAHDGEMYNRSQNANILEQYLKSYSKFDDNDDDDD